MSKSLAEFAARRRQRIEIIFSLDMCVRENTSQSAAHIICAQQTASLLSENPEDFSDSLREPAAFAAGPLLLPYPTGADLSISEGK